MQVQYNIACKTQLLPRSHLPLQYCLHWLESWIYYHQEPLLRQGSAQSCFLCCVLQCVVHRANYEGNSASLYMHCSQLHYPKAAPSSRMHVRDASTRLGYSCTLACTDRHRHRHRLKHRHRHRCSSAPLTCLLLGGLLHGARVALVKLHVIKERCHLHAALCALLGTPCTTQPTACTTGTMMQQGAGQPASTQKSAAHCTCASFACCLWRCAACLVLSWLGA